MDDKMMVIDISATGEVAAMHRDQFSLGFLGDQEIERASDIKFNSATQRWAIHLKQGDGFVENPPEWLSGFAQYDEARKFEVKFLETCRMLSIDPLAPLSGGLASIMRKTTPADFLQPTKAV